MTSQISRDDIEASLWKFAQTAATAGGRIAPWMIERELRIIDGYAISMSRQKQAPVLPVQPKFEYADPYAYILPGKYDLELNLCRCPQCEKVKILNADNFVKDSKNPCGYRMKCKLCRVKKKDGTEGIPKPNKKYKCRGCTQMRDVNDFPEAKKNNPLLSMSCNFCARKYGWRGGQTAEDLLTPAV